MDRISGRSAWHLRAGYYGLLALVVLAYVVLYGGAERLSPMAVAGLEAGIVAAIPVLLLISQARREEVDSGVL